MNGKNFLNDKSNAIALGTILFVVLLSFCINVITVSDISFFTYFGGLNYIIAKIYVSYYEWSRNLLWRKAGWLVFLIGVIGWVVILSRKQDWIVLSVELFGALLLFYAYRSDIIKTDERKDKLIAKKILKICIFVVLLIIG